MAITLRIDNFDQLPDGGPIEYTAGARGFDIGRGQHLDWCLPDESRFISTNHAEIRYEAGSYYLNDVSKNGTYVNGSEGRVQSPYRLQNGDRLKIGPYLISVAVGGAGAAEPVAAQPAPRQQDFAPPDGDLWGVGGSTPPPADRRWFANEQRRGQRAPDVLDHFIDMPAVRSAPESPFGAGGPAPYPNGGAPYAPGPAAGWPPQQPAPYPQNTQFPGGAPQNAPFPGAAPQGAPFPGAPPQTTQFPGGLPQNTQFPHTTPPAAFPPAYPAPQPGAPPAAISGDMPAGAFIAALAAAAGISPQAFAGRPADDVAAEIGAIIRTVAEQLAGLLRARAAAKLMGKSSNRTMITAQNNNPLKFVPDVREALEIMFARNRTGYLTAAQSFKEGFDNIRTHEVATYAAMQKALARLAEDLTPENVEDSAGGGGFGNKKARAWDIYVERWNAKTSTENGILDLFLAYFGEAYDTSNKS